MLHHKTNSCINEVGWDVTLEYDHYGKGNEK